MIDHRSAMVIKTSLSTALLFGLPVVIIVLVIGSIQGDFETAPEAVAWASEALGDLVSRLR